MMPERIVDLAMRRNSQLDLANHVSILLMRRGPELKHPAQRLDPRAMRVLDDRDFAFPRTLIEEALEVRPLAEYDSELLRLISP